MKRLPWWLRDLILAAIFSVGKDKAIALAAVVLALQTAAALIGGLILAARVAAGAWSRPSALPAGRIS